MKLNDGGLGGTGPARIAPSARVEGGPRPARNWLWVAIVLALVSCLPFLFANQPQLTDYGSHLARYHVMLEAGHNPVIDRYYEFQWMWAGNLGADLLMLPLGHLLGVERAGWLIGLMLPPLTGLGIVAVEWTLRRRIGLGSVLAFVTIWSPAMGMGFYNFCLSLALALLAFAGWVRLEGWRWRWALFLPVGLIVWLCHASGWGVLGVLVFGYEWSQRKHWRSFLAPWPLLPPLALQLASSAASGLFYGKHTVSYKIGIWFKALRDQSMHIDIATLCILLAAMLVALLAKRFDGRMGWAALILVGLTIVMPRHLGGGDYADWRLIAVALMAGCLAIDWQPPRWAFALAAALFLGRLGLTTFAWHESSQRLERSLGALDKLPRGAKVAVAVFVPLKRWSTDAAEHASGYAVVRRDALVNSNFAIPGIHMLHQREGSKKFVDPSQRIVWVPGRRINLTKFKPAREADYLWYFGTRQPDLMPEGAIVLYRTPTSFLARLAKTPGRS